MTKALDKHEIHFEIYATHEKREPGPDRRPDPLMLALAGTRLTASTVRDLLREYFQEVVNLHIEEKLDLDALIEMHAEPAIEKAIVNALENGWGSGREKATVAAMIDRKVREMVSKKVAEEYDVAVTITLHKRGAGDD